MNILALDASTVRSVVALGRADGAVFQAVGDPTIRHGRSLVPTIQQLLRQAGLGPRDLSAVGVGLGPGSFTGLRIGLTAAKTLAYALGIPLVGLDSFEALARSAPAAARRIGVVADAQRGDVFAAEYYWASPGDRLLRAGDVRLEAASAWLAGLVDGTYLIIRDAPRLGLPLPPTVEVAPEASTQADGGVLVALTAEAIARGRRDDPWFLEPLYLRRSAAEEKRP